MASGWRWTVMLMGFLHGGTCGACRWSTEGEMDFRGPLIRSLATAKLKLNKFLTNWNLV